MLCATASRLCLVLVGIGAVCAPAYAYGQQITPEAALEITAAGLDAAQSMLKDGNTAGAAHAAEFASGQFALGLQGLRGYDAELADELHVILLDLAPGIGPGSDIEIDAATELLDGFVAGPSGRGTVVEMLGVADEQYAEYVGGADGAYEVSHELVSRSRQLFESGVDPAVMQDREVQSFFADLEAAVESREGITRIGTLVGAIQRDLLGTETAVYDHSRLYGNIRELYGMMLISLEADDYTGAEEYAIEAYLENFEYVEPALEEADAELMHGLEIDMRERLRQMIRDGEEPGTIEQFLIESILPNLDEAEDKTLAYLEANPLGPAGRDDTAERGDSTGEQQSEVRNEIDFIRASLQEMLAHYSAGDYQSAYATARTAYLDSYEHVEIPLRPIDPDFTLEVEYQFAELRNLIKEQAPYEQVRAASIEIKRSLDESERLVTGTGQLAPLVAFTASFAIIFREGLESVLILGAILTYLEASRNTRFKPYVHYGVIAAIGATALTWVVASYVIEISGANREIIEAIAALSATAVLFYVSFWILNKIEHKKWMEFVKAKVWQATTTGSVMVFVMLAFFTVYREGFETVLFYQAMLGFSKYFEVYVVLGFVLGMASLLVVYFVVRRLGRRLPLRALFGLTMGIGAYLSIAFLGNAVRELQILDWVPYTSMLGTIPRLDINLATVTGIYPTLETVVAQLVLLWVYLGASAYILLIRPRKEAKIAKMRKSRGEADVR